MSKKVAAVDGCEGSRSCADGTEPLYRGPMTLTVTITRPRRRRHTISARA